jgi:DNA processing protein
MQAMNESLARRWLLAARTPGLDAARLAALSAASPTLELLEEPRGPELARLGLTTRGIEWLLAPDAARLEADLRWLQIPGHDLVPYGSPAYPPLLGHAPDPPPVLFTRGAVAHLSDPQIAMVGSRQPTAGGRAIARDFAAWFARAGLCVTSGLARGIDASCHEGALAAEGITVAVLGCGPDQCYPPSNRELTERIASAGTVVSEFPPGTPPLPSNFPRRNRIIAGLSLGTVVVEAAQESGSLITARLAGNAGRGVFAVPSSIHNEAARGCHELIRQGASLIERPEEVLAELKISLVDQVLGTSLAQHDPHPSAGRVLDKPSKILLDALAFEPASVDKLIERTGFGSDSVASLLLLLELDGYVQPHPGGRYSRMTGK